MSKKNWLIIVASVSLTLLLFVGALNYIIDPLQHYRKATWYRTCFCEDARYLNPGLARNFNYDSIIIGSSMSENFVPSYIDERLKTKVLKLSISGATAYEENRMMETAIRTGKVRNIIFGLDVFSFMGDPKGLRYGDGSVPFHLYDNSYLNDYKYLLNIDTLVNQSRHSITASLFNKREQLDIDMAYNWSRSYTFSKENAVNDLLTRVKRKKISAEKLRFAVLKESFDQNIMPHIKSNPQIKFYIFYPPYSILTWVDISEKGFLEDALNFNRYVFEATRQFNNVKVYNFQDEGKITLDLDNYKDVNHYSQTINEFIIDSIAKNAYLMTEENAEGHFERLKDQVKGYEVKL